MRVETEAQHDRRLLRELARARKSGWVTPASVYHLEQEALNARRRAEWEAAYEERRRVPVMVHVNGRDVAITHDQLDAIDESANAALDYDCSPSAERMIEAVLRTLERAGVVFIMPPAVD